MRCLLDKVTARYLLQGLRKIGEQQTPTHEEIATLDFFAVTLQGDVRLYIAPPTANVLLQLAQTPRYTVLIQFVLRRVYIARPVRYFTRWARRLRDLGFTREDAAILALATFGSDATDETLGMDYVATFDGPMINHWITRQTTIQARLTAMRADIPAPYNQALIPQVLRPQEIIL